MINYGIKIGYTSRLQAAQINRSPDIIVWQPDVYPIAVVLAKELGVKRIIDAGCGCGDKLQEIAESGLQYIGVDLVESNLACARRHNARFNAAIWIQHDLDSPEPALPVSAVDSVVIASDVIEHVRYPDRLLRKIQYAAGIVLSTPERDLIYGIEHNGPPPNETHIREWNRDEISKFVSDALPQFQWESLLTRSNSYSEAKHTTLLVGRRNK